VLSPNGESTTLVPLSLPGKEQTVRGYSAVSLLIVDEASRVPDPLYQSVRPMLAVSGGRIVLLSTPFGSRGFFYHEWTNGASDWHRVRVTARDVPRISPEWLEAERERIGPYWYAQEYDVQFTDLENQIWSSRLIDSAITEEVPPLFGSAGEPRFADPAVRDDVTPLFSRQEAA
jgi:hypothetical protein